MSQSSGIVHTKGSIDLWRNGVHIGIVTSVDDPQSLGRVQVRLTAIDPGGDALIWSRLAVPFAGDNYGAFLVPDIGTEVLVAFTAGDSGAPIVLGNMWNGSAQPPEALDNDVVDRWSLSGKAGTRIAIEETASGKELVEIETPNGVKAKITDEGGGKITLKAGSQTIKLSPSGVKVRSSGTVDIEGSTINLKASTINLQSPFTDAAGFVRCNVLISDAVLSSMYSPGIGNLW
ncbi:MAG: phage baseplate assembly protein V [Pseudomonadota bacterium]